MQYFKPGGLGPGEAYTPRGYVKSLPNEPGNPPDLNKAWEKWLATHERADIPSRTASGEIVNNTVLPPSGSRTGTAIEAKSAMTTARAASSAVTGVRAIGGTPRPLVCPTVRGDQAVLFFWCVSCGRRSDRNRCGRSRGGSTRVSFRCRGISCRYRKGAYKRPISGRFGHHRILCLRAFRLLSGKVVEALLIVPALGLAAGTDGGMKAPYGAETWTARAGLHPSERRSFKHWLPRCMWGGGARYAQSSGSQCERFVKCMGWCPRKDSNLRHAV
jgi:hypothetical protein